MINLPDEMRTAFENAMADRVPALVGSASSAGEPDIAYKGSVVVWDEENLAFWERAKGTTLRNMEENQLVVVLYRNPGTRQMWKLFGRARLLREGDLREEIMGRMPQVELDRDPERTGVAVLIEVDKVFQAGSVLMTRE